MTEIRQWLDSGAEVREGLRLLSIYAPNLHLEKLVLSRPDRYHSLLMKTLSGIAGETVAETAAKAPSLRDDYPFLSEPDCPPELKILAADKITAYRNFARYHEKLFSCSTLEECLDIAKNVIKFYNENAKIRLEFSYYQENHSILGKHPIFREMQRRNKLRSEGIIELMNRQRRLKGGIWRVRDNLKKTSEPKLIAERETLLESKLRELSEVEHLIEQYKSAYGKK